MNLQEVEEPDSCAEDIGTAGEEYVYDYYRLDSNQADNFADLPPLVEV